jgi:hypothetical protein
MTIARSMEILATAQGGEGVRAVMAAQMLALSVPAVETLTAGGFCTAYRYKDGSAFFVGNFAHPMIASAEVLNGDPLAVSLDDLAAEVVFAYVMREGLAQQHGEFVRMMTPSEPKPQERPPVPTGTVPCTCPQCRMTGDHDPRS